MSVYVKQAPWTCSGAISTHQGFSQSENWTTLSKIKAEMDQKMATVANLKTVPFLS